MFLRLSGCGNRRRGAAVGAKPLALWINGFDEAKNYSYLAALASNFEGLVHRPLYMTKFDKFDKFNMFDDCQVVCLLVYKLI